MGATLDTGGWLALTRQGLAPCKTHQASLGALTPASADGRERQRVDDRLQALVGPYREATFDTQALPLLSYER